MTTKFIGMKEFRQNMTKYSLIAKKQNIRFIIIKKNVPILEVSPISESDYSLVNTKRELDLAEKQIKGGKSFTLDQVKEMLNIV